MKKYIKIFYLPERFKIKREIAELKKVYTDERLDNIVGLLLKNDEAGPRFENKVVLIKPNWVLHPSCEDDNYCLITNDGIIISLLKTVLALKPKRIILADAPIQRCQWNKMHPISFYDAVDALSYRNKIPIDIMDLRRTVFNKNENEITKEIRPISEYVIFDTGHKSFLEPISNSKNRFRVTDYDPRKLTESHSKENHKYCIAKELFEADVVITIPKVKTHQKVGITNALKILVGLNGDKDYLPHHRVGGTGLGGDCYPGSNPVRRMAEYFFDGANKHIGNWRYNLLFNTGRILWKTNPKSQYHNYSAGWYGNDTTWRMALDLNMIAHYGDRHGNLLENKQREIYSLCDGIIGGEGEGPLNPQPFPLGILSFSNDSALTDLAMSLLMQFDYKKIPLIREAVQHYGADDCEIFINEEKVESIDMLKPFSYPAKPASGWSGHIENNDLHNKL